MNPQHLSHNLHRLRLAKGLSQDELAQAAGISRVAYVNIERQKTEPKAQTVRALAHALQVRVPDLLAEATVLNRVRFRSTRRLKGREQVLVEVGRRLQDFAQLEDLLDAHSTKDFGALRKVASRHRRHGTAAVASAIRQHFELSESEPVYDICGLLENEGVKVLSLNIATDAFLGLSVAENDGGPAIVVNTWSRLPVEHWIFSAAHELGHLLLHLQAYQVEEHVHDREQEREADEFASHFLMPDAVFKREWADTIGLPLFDRVLKVKRVFRVSWRTVIYRVAQSLPDANQRTNLWTQFVTAYRTYNSKVQLGLDEPAGVSDQIYRGLSDWHKAGSEPAGMDRHDFQGDRLWRLVRQAVMQQDITMARGAEILGIGIKEMRGLVQSWAS